MHERPRPTRVLRPALALAAAVFLVAGCSSGGDSDDGDNGGDDESPAAVDRAALEEEVSTQLEAQVGQAPDAVDCPDELPAEVDASVRCTLTAGPDTVGLSVTVTEVGDDGDVKFDVLVDDEVQ